MRFLIDAQLPPALAQVLRDRGHAAEHIAEIGPPDASDRALWQYAIAADAVIVTKDEDFAHMLAVLAAEPAPAVVWVRVGNTRRAALLSWFDPLIGRIVRMIDEGHRLIELR